jgi:deoxyadenosine/deoxycytidine kinase
MSSFIAVAGSIATGKTGLVKRLATSLNGVALCEDVSRNRYFERFYAEPTYWAFRSQVAFAADSLRRHVLAASTDTAVQDRTIYEVVDVFGELLHELGLLDSDDLSTLAEFRECGLRLSRQPTLLIHLHAPAGVLLARSHSRSRPGEQHLTLDYFEKLRQRYDRFVKDWTYSPILEVDTSAIDLRQQSGYERLLQNIHGSKEM